MRVKSCNAGIEERTAICSACTLYNSCNQGSTSGYYPKGKVDDSCRTPEEQYTLCRYYNWLTAIKTELGRD